MKDKKRAIFNAARKLFYSKGFKDTNVAEIAKNAGIGVGTFYNYYPSKEEIFLKVFNEEDMNLKRSLFQQIKRDDDLVNTSGKLMMQYMENMNSNRILGEWYNRELFTKLEQYSYQHNGIEHIADFMHHDIARLVQQWKSAGKMRKDIDDEMILAILYSIVYVDMHKTEIGIQHFPRIISLLYEFIMKGLTEQKN